jgi:hypothetical protein
LSTKGNLLFHFITNDFLQNWHSADISLAVSFRLELGESLWWTTFCLYLFWLSFLGIFHSSCTALAHV